VAHSDYFMHIILTNHFLIIPYPEVMKNGHFHCDIQEVMIVFLNSVIIYHQVLAAGFFKFRFSYCWYEDWTRKYNPQAHEKIL